MKIRPFCSRDSHSAERMIRKSLAQLNHPDYRNWIVQRLQHQYSKHYLSRLARSGCALIAIEKGRVLGTVCLQNDIVSMLFVDPAYLRRGIASRLMKHIEERAKCQNILQLKLTASITALAFYRRQDYRIINIRRSVKTGVLFEMVKKL